MRARVCVYVCVCVRTSVSVCVYSFIFSRVGGSLKDQYIHGMLLGLGLLQGAHMKARLLLPFCWPYLPVFLLISPSPRHCCSLFFFILVLLVYLFTPYPSPPFLFP